MQIAAAYLKRAIVGRDNARHIDALRRRLAGELGALIGRLWPALGGDQAPASGSVTSALIADPEIVRTLVARMQKHLSELDAAAAESRLARSSAKPSLPQNVQGNAFGEVQVLLERAALTLGLLGASS